MDRVTVTAQRAAKQLIVSASSDQLCSVEAVYRTRLRYAYGILTQHEQEALLMQRNRASTPSVEIAQNAAPMFDGLHLKRHAKGE